MRSLRSATRATCLVLGLAALIYSRGVAAQQSCYWVITDVGSVQGCGTTCHTWITFYWSYECLPEPGHTGDDGGPGRGDPPECTDGAPNLSLYFNTIDPDPYLSGYARAAGGIATADDAMVTFWLDGPGAAGLDTVRGRLVSSYRWRLCQRARRPTR